MKPPTTSNAGRQSFSEPFRDPYRTHRRPQHKGLKPRPAASSAVPFITEAHRFRQTVSSFPPSKTRGGKAFGHERVERRVNDTIGPNNPTPDQQRNSK